MSPQLILETIKSICEALAEYLRWLQTPEGQKFSSQVMTDRNAWDKFWADAAAGITKLFKGELWK